MALSASHHAMSDLSNEVRGLIGKAFCLKSRRADAVSSVVAAGIHFRLPPVLDFMALIVVDQNDKINEVHIAWRGEIHSHYNPPSP